MRRATSRLTGVAVWIFVLAPTWLANASVPIPSDTTPALRDLLLAADDAGKALIEPDDLDYFADESLLVAIHIAVQLGRPLFLEGEAGVGKTEVAKVLAAMADADLIRLQCYEGLDVGQALYEWDYARQMMAIRLLEARGEGASATPHGIMSREYLIARPLLQAIEASSELICFRSRIVSRWIELVSRLLAVPSPSRAKWLALDAFSTSRSRSFSRTSCSAVAGSREISTLKASRALASTVAWKEVSSRQPSGVKSSP